MQDQARTLFIEMIRDCGEDIVRMQSSFEMYIAQYLQDFPEERKVLVDAFKVGIPLKIIQHAGEKDFGTYLDKLGPRFAEAAQRPEDECAWGVATWSIALNRTSGYMKPQVLDKFYAEDHIDHASEKQKETIAQTAMTIIVSAGGFTGGALAAVILPLVSTAVEFSYDAHGRRSVMTESDIILFFLIIGCAAGALCGTAAFCGWWIGKGAENPWASFSVACGTAFTMTIIAMFVPFGFIVKACSIFASTFAATYKSAARGGMY